MPEGDSLHTIAGWMAPLVVGETVDELFLRASGRVAQARGSSIDRIEAIGKHLLIDIGDLTVRTHLGMYGRWRAMRRTELLPAWARWADVRIVAGPHVLLCSRARQAEVLRGAARHRAVEHLGPDLLTIADGELEATLADVCARARAASGGRRPIGDLLLDQTVAAGIGNVYKSEVLFLAGVDPWRAAADLDDQMLTALYRSARALLAANVGPGRRVTVARPERRSAGAQPRMWVYGRRGEPCLRCGARIQMSRQGDQARSTYWCPRCQQVD